MEKITRVGVATVVSQVDAGVALSCTVLARPPSPLRFMHGAATLPAACVIATQSCSAAHPGRHPQQVNPITRPLQARYAAPTTPKEWCLAERAGRSGPALRQAEQFHRNSSVRAQYLGQRHRPHQARL